MTQILESRLLPSPRVSKVASTASASSSNSLRLLAASSVRSTLWTILANTSPRAPRGDERQLLCWGLLRLRPRNGLAQPRHCQLRLWPPLAAIPDGLVEEPLRPLHWICGHLAALARVNCVRRGLRPTLTTIAILQLTPWRWLCPL